MVALVASTLTAGLLVALHAAFAQFLGITRANTGVQYGNGGGTTGKKDLTHLIRAQSNIAEYGPYLIIAFFFTEYNELLSTSVLTTLGVLTFLIRLGHGLQLANPNKLPVLFRLVGVLWTNGTLFVLSGLNIYYGASKE